jgi:hypothetical protein
MMLVSWAPLADRAQSLFPNPLKLLPLIGEWIKGGVLRATLLGGLFDGLKLKIFFTPVRWHAREVTPAWQATEARAARVLHRFAWDLDSAWTGRVHPLWRLFLAVWLPVARVWIVLAQLNQYRVRLAARALSALRGDREAWGRIARRAGLMWRQIIGAKVKSP